MLLLVHLEMNVTLQFPRDLLRLGIAGDVVVGGTGDDQRRPRLVDEDVVDLVDHGVV